MTHHHPLSFIDHQPFLFDGSNISPSWLMPDHRPINHRKLLLVELQHFAKSIDTYPWAHRPLTIYVGKKQHFAESGRPDLEFL
jgi:hypothetical protein